MCGSLGYCYNYNSIIIKCSELKVIRDHLEYAVAILKYIVIEKSGKY